LAGEKIEDRRRRARVTFRRLGTSEKEPRVDEFVLMACGTVVNRVILPVPTAIFSPALRIHIAFDAVHGRSPRLSLSLLGIRVRRALAGRSSRLGCFLGCFDRAKLILRGGEQIVGLVRRLVLRLYVGWERFLVAIVFGVRGMGFSGRTFGLDCGRPFVGRERFLAAIGFGVRSIGFSGRPFRL